MLAHAWRLQQGLPLYRPPSLDFVPFLYPPGYPALLAALGAPVGLSPALGRMVSLLGIFAAGAALVHVVRRAQGPWWLALSVPAIFLGTYPHAGAFFDLVRPDSVGLGLLAWSIALSVDDRDPRGASPWVAGGLLAAAFAMKHNLAAFGLPLLVGWGLRRGWRGALAFSVASAVPAGLLTLGLQWESDGAFLRYLLHLPSQHPWTWRRAWLFTPREVGTPLPFAAGAVGLWAVLAAMRRQSRVPMAVAAIVSVWAGMLVAWPGTYRPPGPQATVYNAPSSVAFWAFGAVPVAMIVWAWGARGRGIGPRTVSGVGAGAVAVLTAAAMRGHEGGFVNVHMPLLWCLAAGLGAVGARWMARTQGRAREAAATVMAGVVSAQLLWSLALLEPATLRPTPADYAAGQRVVDAVAAVDGPVLSPFAAWIPVYAGREPSLHYMGVWDLDYPGAPYREDLQRYREALKRHHWAAIVGSNQRFLDGLTQDYRPAGELVPPKSGALMPKTGWNARPWRMLKPKRTPP